MKIAIPATEEQVLCPHFGHAPYFAVVEVDNATRRIGVIQLLKPEQGGHAAVPPWLRDLGVTTLIAGGLGQLAIENLHRHGIDVQYGAPELPVAQIAEHWLQGTLTLNPRPCDHKHDPDCEHGQH